MSTQSEFRQHAKEFCSGLVSGLFTLAVGFYLGAASKSTPGSQIPVELAQPSGGPAVRAVLVLVPENNPGVALPTQPRPQLPAASELYY